MREKLADIFNFLKENRKYNKELQIKYYSSLILPFKTKEEKIVSILYNTASTQSQPKINNLSEFYKSIFEDLNSLNSFKNFINKINPNQQPSYKNLYIGMEKQKGWGSKTSALLTKTIFHLHNGEYPEYLKIWDDIPKTLKVNDEFYLPVDAVIIAIFAKLKNQNWNFNQINSLLKQNYQEIEIEIWDDLWFWGFITQEGSGVQRDFKWNENKYWILKESNKEPKIINEIKLKANEFLQIIEKHKY